MASNLNIFGLPNVESDSSVTTRTLRIKVVEGVNLAKKDFFHASDPYVRLSLYQDDKRQRVITRQSTRFIKRTLNPKWNEEFLFKTRDDFLGLVELQLQNLSLPIESPNQFINCKNWTLKQRSAKSKVQGHVTLYLAYLQTENNASPDDVSDGVIDQRELEMPDVAVALNQIGLAGSTSSVHPIDAGQCHVAPLPPGWEEKRDDAGRTYYVNHNGHTTQWARPTMLNQALPPDWEERTDANGRSYYINHRTRVSQWDFPSRSSDQRSNVDIVRQRSVEVAQLFRQRRHISQDDSTSHESESSEAVHTRDRTSHCAVFSPQNIDDDPLPPGWAMGTAPNGRHFFIDHNDRRTTWEDPRRPKELRVRSPSVGDSPTPVFHSTSDDLLGSIGPLPAVPYSRDYKRKYDYFRSRLRKPKNLPKKFDIKVSRDDVLEDSYKIINGIKNPDFLKARLWIVFDGEVGLDYGGIAREWFYLLSKEMFNPYYGLFEYSAMDNYTLQINNLSGILNEDHLSYFEFIGRIAGMAIYHGKLLDAFFIRPFYKMMLGKQIVLYDMESVDSEYFNSMLWIKENDPSDLELHFSVEEDQFGQITERDLISNGRNINVTNENKLLYIELILKWRFVSSVEAQMTAFMKGVNALLPLNSLKIFDENELELLMCGLQDIDVNDWKKNTAYKGEYSANHPVVVDFWKAVYSCKNEMRSRLLQFVTGTSRVPMNGFAELYGSNGPQLFTIEKWGTTEQLPRAHTCFNRLDLPPYENYDMLRSKLIKAVDNTQGFEGVD